MERESRILKYWIDKKGKCNLLIRGMSMFPVIRDGEWVEVVDCQSYIIGDILIFEYKDEGLLAHRLIKIYNNRYYCKGDNSFRVEDVGLEQIIGKVKRDNDINNTLDFIEASYEISRLFKRCKYNIERMREQSQYIEYNNKYLELKDE